MSVPMRTSYRPGMGVLRTSSICAAVGLRAAKFLRMAASSAHALAQAATRAAAAARRGAIRDGLMMLGLSSGAERAGDEPALEWRDPVDESHSLVAKFPCAGHGRGKKLPQAVDGAGHRPRGPQPGARIAAQQGLVAEAAPGFALGEHV